MAVFFVVAFVASGPLIDLVVPQKYAGNCHRADAGKWFIQAPLQTSKDMSDSLGITADPPNVSAITGVVVAIKGYFGRGPTDLWEWLASRPG